jgi:hypothetical protein
MQRLANQLNTFSICNRGWVSTTHVLSNDLFVLGFLLQLSHDVLGRNQNLGVLLQKLSEVLEQRVLGSQEVKLEWNEIN